MRWADVVFPVGYCQPWRLLYDHELVYVLAGCDLLIPPRLRHSARAEVDAIVQTGIERFGRIDVLVNNAGICPFVDIMEMEPAVWQRTLDVNLTGAFHCPPAVARTMKASGEGERIGTPEDIGKVVVFLASEDALYINGVTLRVDRGFQVLIKG